MLQSSTLQDQMIQSYIEQVFNKYDTDRNGSLDVVEMTAFFNDLFRSLNINVTVTQAQSLEAIKSIDDNSDGLVSKEELFKAFKVMLNPPQQRPQPQVQNYGQQGFQNQGGMNQGYGQQYGGQNYGNQGYGYANQYSPQSYPQNYSNQPQTYQQPNYPQAQGYMNNSNGYGNQQAPQPYMPPSMTQTQPQRMNPYQQVQQNPYNPYQTSNPYGNYRY